MRTARDVYKAVVHELVREMAPHGLHPQLLAAGLWQHVQGLEAKHSMDGETTTSGQVTEAASAASSRGTQASARELALQAAERRAREQRKAHEFPDKEDPNG